MTATGSTAVAVEGLRLSASQVQTFSDCQRKWAFKYIEGIETPPNASAEKGSAVHAELEKYLTGGAIDFTTEIGYIAASGLEHLPKPGTPGLRVEQEFHFIGPSGHSYLGYKDLETPGILWDHKTTSDLRWQKTPEELKTDIAATLYAVDYFRNHPAENDVELRWVYYQTKNTKKSAVTHLRVNQTEVWDRFLEIEQIAETMAAASTQRALDLPPSINHCSAYGGCPHQGRCNLSPLDKMRSHVEQNKLLATLNAKKNGSPGLQAPAAPAPSAPVPATVPLAFAPGGGFAGLPPPPATATPAPVPAANTPATANKLLAKMRAGGAPAATVAPAPATNSAQATAPGQINPPEHQPPPVSPAPAMTPEVAAASGELAASLAQGETAAAPRGRGRPKKAVVAPTGLAVKIETLYLNCGPVGVPVVDAAHFIILAKKRIAEGGLVDYRFADFGHGPGMLAVAAVAELDALEGVISAMRLDTITPEGAVIAVEFMARAGLVVR